MAIKPWNLSSEPYEMPRRLNMTQIQFAVSVDKLIYCLEHNLKDMIRVLCDDAPEATSRIAVDMMLIACTCIS